MQELVRRLLDLATRFELTIRPVHTPGLMLVRPDQTSRGLQPEAPRVRFERSVFDGLAARFGPFSEMLGAERGYERPVVEACEGPARLWLHPSYSTVASALELLGRRLTIERDACPSGLVVVPWAPEAAWWPLTRHLICVARFGVGSRHLEESRLGRWVRVTARRPTVVFAFPRLAGGLVPLSHLVALGSAEAQAALRLREDELTRAAIRWGDLGV